MAFVNPRYAAWLKTQGLVKTKNPPASYNDTFPYNQTERPRFLEEGLPIPPDYLMIGFILYTLKNNPSMLEKIATKWLDTQGHIITALAQAGSGNIVSAYSHSFLIALMLEQGYWIRQRGADDLIAGLNWLTGAQALVDLIGGFSVPQVLQFATPERIAAARPSRPSSQARGAPHVQTNPRE